MFQALLLLPVLSSSFFGHLLRKRCPLSALPACLLIWLASVPFPFSILGRLSNLIVSVPDHWLFIYFAGTAKNNNKKKKNKKKTTTTTKNKKQQQKTTKQKQQKKTKQNKTNNNNSKKNKTKKTNKQTTTTKKKNKQKKTKKTLLYMFTNVFLSQ